jgi:hypothetical protein
MIDPIDPSSYCTVTLNEIVTQPGPSRPTPQARIV